MSASLGRPSQSSWVIRFADFEVDLQAGQLRKHGIRIKLQEQPFQVLTMMLERPGEAITRDELRQQLWPSDTFVDFDHGLNNAINRLREALSDSTDSPRFIETLPRRGYRFIAQVQRDARPAPGVVENPAPTPPLRSAAQVWNKRRISVAAGVAALVLVAASVALRVFFAPPVLTETDVILLTNFVNETGDPIFDNSLDKALEVKLTESPYLSLLSEADVRETLRTMRRDPNERVTRELGIEICKRQGLKAVVVGEIATFGDQYLITLEAIDAATEKSLGRRQEQAKSKDEVIAALGKAGSRLRRQLGENLSSLEKYDAPLDLATTSSLDALQAYRAGQTEYRAGRRRESIPLFERAVELDPQFCSAYAMLGSAYHSVGDEQASRMNFAKAFELKDRRLTLEENYRTTALYHAGITGNLEQEIAILTLYKLAYPRSADAYNLLGIAYAQIGRTEEALQEFNWAIGHSPAPSAPSYSNASQVLMIMGRTDEAKRLLDQWRQKGSLTPFQRSLRYQIAFIENDAATMGSLAHETPPDDIPWLEIQMKLAFFRGDLRKLRLLSGALVQQQSRGNRGENAADELSGHALLESYLGNNTLARQLCRQAAEAGNNSALGLGNCAKALATSGDVIQAEALAAKLDRLFPDDTCRQKVHLPLIRSIIERQRGNAAKALDLLAPVARYEQTTMQVPYERAQAYLSLGAHDKAAAEFEKLIALRAWPEAAVFDPLAQLGLARTHAKQADREKSRKAYEDFFATWKEADPHIPVLRQARTEYKRLASTDRAIVLASEKRQ